MDMEAEHSGDEDASAEEEDAAEEPYESDFVDDEIQSGSQLRSLSVGMDLYYSGHPSCRRG